jgi:asparagine N-glycosylation enzyme membrane subunit Stt3
MAAEFAWHPRESRPAAQGLHLFPVILLAQIPVLLLVCCANHWYALGSFDFDAPSLLQPLLLVALSLWALLLRDWRGREWDGKVVAWGALALAVSGVLAFKGVPSLASFLAAPPPIFKTVDEMQPLFGHYPQWSLGNSSAFFGHALWPALLLAGLFACQAGNPAGRLILSWFLATGALTLVQLRYAYHFSLPVAFFLGYGLDRLLTGLARQPMLRPAFLAKALAAATAVGLLLPALRSTSGLRRFREGMPGSADLAAACDWIRLNTPATKSLWKDQGVPEYGVYSLHDIGAQIATIAQRPAAAGNFHWLGREILDSLAFFFAQDSDQAYEFLVRRRFRYVLLTDMVHDNSLAGYARLYGIPGYEPAAGPGGAMTVSPRLWDLVYLRLYGADGSLGLVGRGVWVAPVDRFRLIYESAGVAYGPHLWKLFEAVPGVLLTGRCRAGLPVTAASPQRSVQNRSFTYLNEAACGPDHRFKMRLPYSGLCTIGQKGSRRSFWVADADVESGATKELSFLP